MQECCEAVGDCMPDMLDYSHRQLVSLLSNGKEEERRSGRRKPIVVLQEEQKEEEQVQGDSDGEGKEIVEVCRDIIL